MNAHVTIETGFATISMSLVDADPNQPRKTFEEKELRDLAGSIRTSGLLEPIIVQPIGDRFRLIDGERRWRAHKILNAEGILSRIVTGKTALEISVDQIVANDQRCATPPLDEARKFKELIEAGLPIENLAGRINRERYRIEERLRLLDLEPDLLKLYESGNLTQEAASEVSRVKDHAQQRRLVQMIGRGQLKGFNALRAAVDAVLGSMTVADLFGDAAPKASEEDLHTVSLMERKIDQVQGMVASGWREGQCVIVTKVAPDRARLMADKISAIKKALTIMENDLRRTAAQAEIVLSCAA